MPKRKLVEVKKTRSLKSSKRREDLIRLTKRISNQLISISLSSRNATRSLSLVPVTSDQEPESFS